MYRDLPARLVHAQGAYGGTGVSGRNYCAVMIDIDVTAALALAGLRVTQIEILDPHGAIIAKAEAPIDLRIWLPGRDADHNEITAPFSGAIEAGKTLRLRARADFAFAPYVSTKRRYRLTFATSDATMTVEGPLDSPWPTAGPVMM